MVGSKLREIREATGMNKKEFAQYLGLKYTTYNNYETEAREPASDFLILISEKFDVSIDYLLGLKDESEILHSYQLKAGEYEHIKKYRSLDPYGQETVNYILDREAARTAALNEKDVLIAQLQTKPTNTRIIQFYQSLASAGTGEVIFEDMPVDRIEIPDIPEYKRVSYAIGVNGHSMEPLYYDGDMLLIEPTCQVDIGEIGIFIVGDKAYVKKLGNGELISLNAGYDNIPLTEDSKCMGRVVDKYNL